MQGQKQERELTLVTPYPIPLRSTPFVYSLLLECNAKTFAMVTDNGDVAVYFIVTTMRNAVGFGFAIMENEAITKEIVTRRVSVLGHRNISTEEKCMAIISNILAHHGFKLPPKASLV